MKIEVKILFSKGCDNTQPTIDLIEEISSELGIKIDLKMVILSGFLLEIAY